MTNLTAPARVESTTVSASSPVHVIRPLPPIKIVQHPAFRGRHLQGRYPAAPIRVVSLDGSAPAITHWHAPVVSPCGAA